MRKGNAASLFRANWRGLKVFTQFMLDKGDGSAGVAPVQIV
jgi:hypothetical protein